MYFTIIVCLFYTHVLCAYGVYVALYCQYQRESRYLSATRIFFKKWDDATSGPETNHQVLASSLISFT